MEKFGNQLLRDSIRTILKVNLHPIMFSCHNCRYKDKVREDLCKDCKIKWWGASDKFCNQITNEIMSRVDKYR